MCVIGGKFEALDFKRFSVLPVFLGTNLMWHKFGVVQNLHLKVLIRADIFAPHLCSVYYLKDNKKRLELKDTVHASCNRFCNDPNVNFASQLRFVDRVP